MHVKFWSKYHAENEHYTAQALGNPIAEMECHVVSNDVVNFSIPPIAGYVPEQITHCQIGSRYYQCDCYFNTIAETSWAVDAYFDAITTYVAPGTMFSGTCIRHPTGVGVHKVVDFGGDGFRTKVRCTGNAQLKMINENGNPSNYGKFGFVVLTYATSSLFRAKLKSNVEYERVAYSRNPGGPKVIYTGRQVETNVYDGNEVAPGDTELTTYLLPVSMNSRFYGTGEFVDTTYKINGIGVNYTLKDVIDGSDDILGLPSDQLVSSALIDFDPGMGIDLSDISNNNIKVDTSRVVVNTMIPGRPVRMIKLLPFNGFSPNGQFYTLTVSPVQNGITALEDTLGRAVAIYDQEQTLDVRQYIDEYGAHCSLTGLDGTVTFDYPSVTTLSDDLDVYKSRQLEFDQQALDLAIKRETQNAALGAVGGGINTGIGLGMMSEMAGLSSSKTAGARTAVGMKGGIAGFVVGAASSAISSYLNIKAMREDFALSQKALANEAHGQVTAGGNYNLMSFPIFKYGMYNIYTPKSQAYINLSGVGCLHSGNWGIQSGFWKGNFEFTGVPKSELLNALFLEGVRVRLS